MSITEQKVNSHVKYFTSKDVYEHLNIIFF